VKVELARTVSGRPVECALDRLALLVIDMQRDFLDPRSYYASTMDEAGGAEIRKPLDGVLRLLEACRATGVLVVFTREGHAPDLSDLDQAKRFRYLEAGKGIGDETALGRLLIRGEPGHELLSELEHRGEEPVVDKHSQDAFIGTGLDELLSQYEVTHLLITGVTAGCCVHSTLRGATDRGYFSVLVRDAVGSYRAVDREMAVAMVEAENGALGFTAESQQLVDHIQAAASLRDEK
jgi:nicotinamidase-related amidase